MNDCCYEHAEESCPFLRTQRSSFARSVVKFIPRRLVMQVVYERCAAIDVHQKTAVTTILITQANGHLRDARLKPLRP